MALRELAENNCDAGLARIAKHGLFEHEQFHRDVTQLLLSGGPDEKRLLDAGLKLEPVQTRHYLRHYFDANHSCIACRDDDDFVMALLRAHGDLNTLYSFEDRNLFAQALCTGADVAGTELGELLGELCDDELHWAAPDMFLKDLLPLCIDNPDLAEEIQGYTIHVDGKDVSRELHLLFAENEALVRREHLRFLCEYYRFIEIDFGNVLQFWFKTLLFAPLLDEVASCCNRAQAKRLLKIVPHAKAKNLTPDMAKHRQVIVTALEKAMDEGDDESDDEDNDE